VANATFTLDDGTPLEVDITLRVPCRCGHGVVTVGKIEGLGRHIVLHEEPRCHTFERLEPLDFLRWIRTGVECMQ
jgi:hypothetical protein